MPPKAAPPTLKLVLTRTSLYNVTIATPSDEFYYEIVTYKWDPLRTNVRKLDPNTTKMLTIAEMKMEHERSRYTEMRFTNLSDPEEEVPFRPLEEFFQAKSGSDDRNVLGSFAGNDNKRYCWQKVKGSIELFDETASMSLARYHTHHRHLGVLRMSKHPYIDVDPQLSDIMDKLIVSFLLAEGKHRGNF